MNKRKYQKPKSTNFEIAIEGIIAASGDAGGTINPMPWGDNKKDGINSDDWSDSNENSYWE